LKNLYFVIPAAEPEMDSIPYLRERQLPPTPLIEGGEGGSALAEGGEGGSSITEGGRGEKMPDPRIKRGAGKSGMTGRKNQVFKAFRSAIC